MKDIISTLKAWIEITKDSKNNKNAFDYLYMFSDKLSEDLEEAIKEIEYYRKYLGDSCGD